MQIFLSFASCLGLMWLLVWPFYNSTNSNLAYHTTHSSPLSLSKTIFCSIEDIHDWKKISRNCVQCASKLCRIKRVCQYDNAQNVLLFVQLWSFSKSGVFFVSSPDNLGGDGSFSTRSFINWFIYRLYGSNMGRNYLWQSNHNCLPLHLRVSTLVGSLR